MEDTGNTEISVVVLGQKGAGKTVYLAGLYKELSFDCLGSVVTLRPDEGRARELDGIYQRVIDPGREFPDSTVWGVDTWSFECSLTAGTGAEIRKYPLFTVKYADYDGAMLDDARRDDGTGSEQLERFDETVRHADIFIILIDGHKLLPLAQRPPQEDMWLNDYLRSRLANLADAGSTSTGLQPVHFVITKWDLLEGIPLEQVRALLMMQPSLDGHMQWRRARRTGPVRLIPVSVTGSFAGLNEAGVMVKNPAKTVRALNVDVPFAAILPDLIRATRDAAVRQADEETTHSPDAKALRDQLDGLKGAGNFAERARKPVVTVVDRLVSGYSGTRAAGAGAGRAAGRAVDWVEEQIARRKEAVRRQLDEVRQEHLQRQLGTKTRQDALELAIESFEVRLNEFEKNFPGSLLTEDGRDR